jgi:hypothetical protein
MSSHTINCIGIAPEGSKEYLYYAMNRLEIEQEKVKAQKEGRKILYWYAQTKTGVRILKGNQTVEDKDLPPYKTVQCPICQGKGRKIVDNSKNIPLVKSCPVCNSSGITKNKYWNKWHTWQLEEMKKEFQEA